MTTKQLQAPSPLLLLAHTVLTVGQIVLLIVIWSVFFLWAMVVTEYLLIPGLTVLDRQPSSFIDFATTGIGVYVLPFVLVMISFTLFFYRIPRTHDKASVPLEFGLTTLLFVVTHLVVIGLGSFLLGGWLPTALASLLEQMLLIDVGAVAGLPSLLPSLAITALMLAGLFWLQASERWWQWVHRITQKSLGLIASGQRAQEQVVQKTKRSQ